MCNKSKTGSCTILTGGKIMSLYLAIIKINITVIVIYLFIFATQTQDGTLVKQ